MTRLRHLGATPAILMTRCPAIGISRVRPHIHDAIKTDILSADRSLAGPPLRQPCGANQETTDLE